MHRCHPLPILTLLAVALPIAVVVVVVVVVAVGRVLEVLSGCKQCVVVVVCGNGCGNGYLSKGITTESKVADTEGSTATGGPL